MDRYEYKISLQEINRLIGEGRFAEAADIADNIDWQRVKNPQTLCRISDVYKINRQYAKARRILMLARDKDPENADIIYSLCELTIFLYGRDHLESDLTNALSLMQAYTQAQPDNPRRLILQYRMYNVNHVSIEEKISILQQLKSEQYSAHWGYELAKCLHEAGRDEEAIVECRSILESFGGKYAGKAEELLNSLRAAGEEKEKAQEEADTRKVEVKEKKALPGKKEEEKSEEEKETGEPKEESTQEETPEVSDSQETEEDTLAKNVREGMESLNKKEPETPEEPKYIQAENQLPNYQPQQTPSISQVMDEWEKIRRGVRRNSEEKRNQQILEDTGKILAEFDENARHSKLEEIENSVEEEQREARSYKTADMLAARPAKPKREEPQQAEEEEKEEAEPVPSEEPAYSEEPGETVEEAAPEKEEEAEAQQEEAPVSEEPKEEEIPAEEEPVPVEEPKQVYPEAGPDTGPLEPIDSTFYEEPQEAPETEPEPEPAPAPAPEPEPVPVPVPAYDYREAVPPESVQVATKRWNAAAVRRAMEAEQQRLKALEERERASLENAAAHPEEVPAPAPQPAWQHPQEEEIPQQAEAPQEAAEEEAPAPEEYQPREPEPEPMPQPEPVPEPIPQPEPQRRRRSPAPAPQQPAENYVPRRRSPAERMQQAQPQPQQQIQPAAQEAAPAQVSEKKTGLRQLSNEEKQLFGPLAVVKENRDQFVTALDKISLASNTGNVIITGAEGAASKVAQGLLEIIKHSDQNFTGKIAKASGRALNRLGKDKLEKTLSQIENGALLVEGASTVDDNTMKLLYHELEERERGLIVIFLDGKKAMDAFLKKSQKYMGSFNTRIDIKALNDKALVSYGMEYALARDYSIDEMGQLALSYRISSMQTRDHHVSTKEVRDIVDEAISYASRKNLHTLWQILTHKRYDADDRIIIHEKDFQHY